MIRRFLHLLPALAAALWVVTAHAEAPSAHGAPGVRVVAVGDLHGDLDQALAVLRLANLLDAEGRWQGGDAILVQAGDATNRGPQSRGVLDLLRRLQGEAQAAGGQVIPLLGNHEVMNLQGDWRYVSREDLAAYGGLDARKRAFSPEGEHGRWLATLQAVARVGDTVFVHGGVAPRWAELGIDTLNSRVRAALFTGRDPVLGPDGPLWYRGFVLEEEQVACPALARSLQALGARRMVVAHTVRRDGRIQSRCDGRLHVIDTGIATLYGGNLAAWEWHQERTRALYPAGAEVLPEAP